MRASVSKRRSKAFRSSALAAKVGLIVFRATVRVSAGSKASYTTPIIPRPRTLRIS